MSKMHQASKVLTIYDFAVNTLQGKLFNNDLIKNKVVLIVNTASQCGFTTQYSGLEQLYSKYKDSGLVILGFPCNQFNNQEPGQGEEIKEFCQKNFGVTFPMMEKIDVNGSNEHPLYGYMKSQITSLGMKRIKWNFEKFLISRDGLVVERYSSLTTPESLDPIIQKYLNLNNTSN